jgi:hypothetical protein
MENQNTSHPLAFEIAHQPSYSRVELLLRTLFQQVYIGIPHGFLLFFVSIASLFLMFISWFAVLFTGQYPRAFFDFQVRMMRWSMRVTARLLQLSDGYPSFGMSASDEKVKFEMQYPERLSRGHLLLRLFFQTIYVLIPHGFMLFFRMIATLFVVFIAWWAVLFTGKYPKGMHDFNVGTLRWALRVRLYLLFMTDTYPPFSGR